MIAVAVRDLVVRFQTTTAVDGVDLSISPGELFLLLGPSGCGKSTLLRAIAGFAPPERGTIALGGEDVTRLPPHRRKTGMVFQSYALFPHMTVAENVAFGLREERIPPREIEPRVTQALVSVRMEERAGRRIDQLSGGEQQRVALARALVIRPRCLLLDEPLSNLDAKLRRAMREEIRRVCKEFHLTTIYVTHDQKEALAVADRIAVMHRGRILQIGAPMEIYKHPRSRTVASFVGETNLVRGEIVARSGDEVRLTTPLGELRSTAVTSFREGERVWISLRPECIAQTPHDASRERANEIHGTLESTVPLGEIAEHRLRIGETVLRVYQLNPDVASMADHRSLTATVSPSDVTLLPFDGDSDA